ncbi:MAG: hypothetical protein WC169_09935 [Dehalococcoidia bacterium]
MWVFWWGILKQAHSETCELLGIYSWKKAIVSAIAFALAVVILRWLPGGEYQMSGELRWIIAVVIAAALLYLPIFAYKLMSIPSKQQACLKSKLNRYEAGEDEISQLIKKLSSLKMNISDEEKSYIDLLVKYQGKLAIGGITVEPNIPNTKYIDGKTGQLMSLTTKYGITYTQLFEFLRQIRLVGIIDVRSVYLTEHGGYQNLQETYTLNDLGFQVMKRINKEMG